MPNKTKFKVGDLVRDESGNIYVITEVQYPCLKTVESGWKCRYGLCKGVYYIGRVAIPHDRELFKQTGLCEQCIDSYKEVE